MLYHCAYKVVGMSDAKLPLGSYQVLLDDKPAVLEVAQPKNAVDDEVGSDEGNVKGVPNVLTTVVGPPLPPFALNVIIGLNVI